MVLPAGDAGGRVPAAARVMQEGEVMTRGAEYVKATNTGYWGDGCHLCGGASEVGGDTGGEEIRQR